MWWFPWKHKPRAPHPLLRRVRFGDTELRLGDRVHAARKASVPLSKTFTKLISRLWLSIWGTVLTAAASHVSCEGQHCKVQVRFLTQATLKTQGGRGQLLCVWERDGGRDRARKTEAGRGRGRWARRRGRDKDRRTMSDMWRSLVSKQLAVWEQPSLKDDSTLAFQLQFSRLEITS